VQNFWQPIPCRTRDPDQSATLHARRRQGSQQFRDDGRLNEDIAGEEPWWILRIDHCTAVSMLLIFFHYYSDGNRSEINANRQSLPYVAPLHLLNNTQFLGPDPLSSQCGLLAAGKISFAFIRRPYHYLVQVSISQLDTPIVPRLQDVPDQQSSALTIKPKSIFHILIPVGTSAVFVAGCGAHHTSLKLNLVRSKNRQAIGTHT